MSVERDVDQASLRRLMDESELRNLVLDFARCIDGRDWEGYANLFTEDGVFEILGQRRVGREALVAGPKGDLEKSYERTQHYVCNICVDLDGDQAQVLAYGFAVHLPVASDVGRHAELGGLNRIVARRTDEGWRIAEMHVEPIWTGGIPLEL